MRGPLLQGSVSLGERKPAASTVASHVAARAARFHAGGSWLGPGGLRGLRRLRRAATFPGDAQFRSERLGLSPMTALDHSTSIYSSRVRVTRRAIRKTIPQPNEMIGSKNTPNSLPGFSQPAVFCVSRTSAVQSFLGRDSFQVRFVVGHFGHSTGNPSAYQADAKADN